MNGVPLDSLNVSWWHKQVALVSQEPVLFDMSIRENIAFGLGIDNVTQQQIEEAAKEANCHDFITEFPDGYETQINSGLVSGGQKQRCCIARALLRKPKVRSDRLTMFSPPRHIFDLISGHLSIYLSRFCYWMRQRAL